MAKEQEDTLRKLLEQNNPLSPCEHQEIVAFEKRLGLNVINRDYDKYLMETRGW